MSDGLRGATVELRLRYVAVNLDRTARLAQRVAGDGEGVG